MLRGGSYEAMDADVLLSSFRISIAPEGRRLDCGFRVVLANKGSQ